MEQFFVSCRLHNMLWVIADDFNEPLIGEDKFGGRPMSVNRSLLLKECLDKCNTIDLGFSGPVDTQFCTHDLIKEDDWSDRPCTKKKKLKKLKKKFLHHMHQFVPTLYELIHSLHIIKMILRF